MTLNLEKNVPFKNDVTSVVRIGSAQNKGGGSSLISSKRLLKYTAYQMKSTNKTFY